VSVPEGKEIKITMDAETWAFGKITGEEKR